MITYAALCPSCGQDAQWVAAPTEEALPPNRYGIVLRHVVVDYQIVCPCQPDSAWRLRE